MTAFLILAVFIAVIFSSAVFMAHSSSANCPLSATGTSLCPLEPAFLILHEAFLQNDFFNPIAVCLVFLPFLVFPLRFLISFDFSVRRRTMRWLSLFENSPSFV